MTTTNPLRHVGQTAHPEGSTPSAADEQGGDAGSPERHVNPSEGGRVPPDGGATSEPGAAPGGNKPGKIRDLKPGEPPPESSAGS